MIYILRAQIEKDMKEKIGKISREIEILRQNQKRNGSDQKYCNRNKESMFMGLLAYWISLRKESLSLRICQWKLPKLKNQ